MIKENIDVMSVDKALSEFTLKVQSLIINLDRLDKYEKSSNEERTNSESFDTVASMVTREHLEQLAKAVTDESSKFSLLFAVPVTVEAAQSLIKDFYAALNLIFNIIQLKSLTAGPTLHQHITKAAFDLFTSVSQLIDAVRNKNSINSKIDPVLTGVIWSSCNILKSIPIENKSVIISELSIVASTIKDALDELSQIGIGKQKEKVDDYEDDFGEDDIEEDVIEIIGSCLMVIRTSHNLLANINGMLNNLPEHPKYIFWLEDLLKQAHTMAEITDEVASSIYTEGADEVKEQIGALYKISKRFMDLLHSEPKVIGEQSSAQRLSIVDKLFQKALQDLKI